MACGRGGGGQLVTVPTQAEMHQQIDWEEDRCIEPHVHRRVDVPFGPHKVSLG